MEKIETKVVKPETSFFETSFETSFFEGLFLGFCVVNFLGELYCGGSTTGKSYFV